MNLHSRDLVDVLGVRSPTRVRAATFSLDELELYRLAMHLDLKRTADVRVRFDRAGFRGWANQRIVPSGWLCPLNPPRSALPLQKTGPRTPAIYHPKLLIAARSRSISRLIVSTGNLSTADQRAQRNLLVGLDLSRSKAELVENWIDTPAADRRHLCITVEGGGSPRLSIEGSPMWQHIQGRRIAGAHEEWLLAAPFWGHGAVRRALAEGSPSSCAISAYFGNVAEARARGALLPRAKSKWAGPDVRSLKCFAPGRRERPIHHKVVGLRMTKGRKTTVLLYVGSANLTAAGLFGTDGGKTAWNWEAGVLWISDESLWPAALSAATAGISWKKVKIPLKPARDEPPEREGDEESLLRVHLRSVIRVLGRSVTRRPVSDLDYAVLESVRVCWNEGPDRRLAAGGSIQIPNVASRVRVSGIYALCGEPGGRRDVDVELPELSEEPREDIFEPAEDGLRSLLSRLGASAAEGGGGEGSEGDEDEPAPRQAWSDHRFPYAEFYEALKQGHKEDARRWLQQVERSGKVPPFWKAVARSVA